MTFNKIDEYLVYGIAAALLYITWKGIRNFLFSPIRHLRLPGPILAKLTSKWLLMHDLAGHRTEKVHSLHKQFGPVVQVAPNEISFADVACIKDIYGGSTTCIKAPIYSKIGKLGLFQMRDPEQHRARHRRVSPIFAQNILLQLEPLIQEQVGILMDVVERKAGKAFDALHWMRMTALDVAGEILLGKSFDSLKGEKPPAYTHHLDNTHLVFALRDLAPWLCFILSKIPLHKFQEFWKSGDYLYEYGDNALRSYIALYGRKSGRYDLLTKLIAGDAARSISPLTDEEISIEVSGDVFAATDTTGNTMTYALYQLSCNPKWQQRLRNELRGSNGQEKSWSFQSVQHLPVLHAVIMETLRMYPAVPCGLPRITPPQGTKVGNLFIPGNTPLSMQAFTTQRDPTIFPNADTWDPERWISTLGGTVEMKKALLVWGGGTRICLGQNMAMMEMKIVITRLIERFTIRVSSQRTHDDMLITDHFALIPKGGRCEVVFELAK